MKSEYDNKSNKDEDYSFIEKILMILVPFDFYKYDTDLKKNGYFTKRKSKILCVTLGFLFYTIIILLANFA